jgi:hypothetical protein
MARQGSVGVWRSWNWYVYVEIIQVAKLTRCFKRILLCRGMSELQYSCYEAETVHRALVNFTTAKGVRPRQEE